MEALFWRVIGSGRRPLFDLHFLHKKILWIKYPAFSIMDFSIVKELSWNADQGAARAASRRQYHRQYRGCRTESRRGCGASSSARTTGAPFSEEGNGRNSAPTSGRPWTCAAPPMRKRLRTLPRWNNQQIQIISSSRVQEQEIGGIIEI